MSVTAVDLTRRIPAGVARRAVPLLVLALMCASAAREVLSPLQELMKADLHISDNQVAVLQGFAVALPLALVSIPLGRLVDSARRTRILVALTLCCACGCLLTAMARDFETMFVARMLVGVGSVAGTPAAASLASDYSSRHIRGRVLSMLGFGQVLGGALPFLTVGALLGWLPSALEATPAAFDAMGPWRLVQLFYALAMVAAALLLLTLREPARTELGSEFGGSMLDALRELRQFRRVMVPLVLGISMVQMADTAAGIWVVPLLTRVFHQSPEQFGTWMGLLMFVCGCVGTLLGGVATDFCQRRGGRRGIAYGAMAASLLSIVSSSMPVMSSVPLLAAALAIFITAGVVATLMGSSAVLLILPNELRGISSSGINAIAIFVSFGLAPSAVSLLGGAMGLQGDVRVPLMIVSAVTSLLGALAFYLAANAHDGS